MTAATVSLSHSHNSKSTATNNYPLPSPPSSIKCSSPLCMPYCFSLEGHNVYHAAFFSFLSVMPFLFVNIIWNYPVKQFCSSKRKLTINSPLPHVTNNKHKKSKPNCSKGFTTYSVNYARKMLQREIIINIIYWMKNIWQL